MEVNFNNLRKQALRAYDSLVNKLNNSFIDDDNSDRIIINASDIQKDLDDLRQTIGFIAMCNDENDENFKDVYSEVYGEDVQMEIFNKNE